jgi:hypothetical protein
VIETAAIEAPQYLGANLVEFYAGNELHADYGNWFAPTFSALSGMCRAAGFRKVDMIASTLQSQPSRRQRSSLADSRVIPYSAGWQRTHLCSS